MISKEKIARNYERIKGVTGVLPSWILITEIVLLCIIIAVFLFFGARGTYPRYTRYDGPFRLPTSPIKSLAGGKIQYILAHDGQIVSDTEALAVLAPKECFSEIINIEEILSSPGRTRDTIKAPNESPDWPDCHAIFSRYNKWIKSYKAISRQLGSSGNSAMQIAISEMLREGIALSNDIQSWKRVYTIKSPVNGILRGNKHWRSGEMITEGQPLGEVVPNTATMSAIVYVPFSGSQTINVISANVYPANINRQSPTSLKVISTARLARKDSLLISFNNPYLVASLVHDHPGEMVLSLTLQSENGKLSDILFRQIKKAFL